MSGPLVSAVFASALPTWLKPYAAACASFAQDDGSRVFPSVATLARMVGKSTRSTKRALHELRARGVLTVVHAPGRYRATRYQLRAIALPHVGDPQQLSLFSTGATPQKSAQMAAGRRSFPQFPQASTAMGDMGVTPWVTWVSPDPSVDPSVRTPHLKGDFEKRLTANARRRAR